MLSRERWVELLVGARTGTEALLLGRRYRPHVAIIAADLAGESVADVCEQLPQESPATRILLRSDKWLRGLHSHQFDVAGIVPNTWDGRSIAEAARLVALGNEFFALDRSKPPDAVDLLTPREQTVLEMIANGATNREIAASLNLSDNTVKDYVSAVYRKLGARNRPSAVVRAHRLGFLS